MSPTKMLSRLSIEHRRVHEALKTRLPSFDARNPPRLDAPELVSVMRLVEDAVGREDWAEARTILDLLPAYADTLAMPRHAGHDRHMVNLSSAVDRRLRPQAEIHLTRLRRIIRVVASDDPLEDGAFVRIHRTRHGWYDGHVSGRTVPGSHGSVVETESGERYEIEHRRDVSRTR